MSLLDEESIRLTRLDYTSTFEDKNRKFWISEMLLDLVNGISRNSEVLDGSRVRYQGFDLECAPMPTKLSRKFNSWQDFFKNTIENYIRALKANYSDLKSSNLTHEIELSPYTLAIAATLSDFDLFKILIMVSRSFQVWDHKRSASLELGIIGAPYEEHIYIALFIGIVLGLPRDDLLALILHDSPEDCSPKDAKSDIEEAHSWTFERVFQVTGSKLVMRKVEAMTRFNGEGPEVKQRRVLELHNQRKNKDEFYDLQIYMIDSLSSVLGDVRQTRLALANSKGYKAYNCITESQVSAGQKLVEANRVRLNYKFPYVFKVLNENGFPNSDLWLYREFILELDSASLELRNLLT